MSPSEYVQAVINAEGRVRLVDLEVRITLPAGRKSELQGLLELGRPIKEAVREHLLLEEAKRIFEAPKVWTTTQAYYYAKHLGPSHRISTPPASHPGGTEAQWQGVAAKVITGQHDVATAAELNAIRIGLEPFQGPLMDEARARIKRLIEGTKAKTKYRKGGKQTR